MFNNLLSDWINVELAILSAPNLIGVRGFLISWAIFLATSDQATNFCACIRSVMSSNVRTYPIIWFSLICLTILDIKICFLSFFKNSIFFSTKLLFLYLISSIKVWNSGKSFSIWKGIEFSNYETIITLGMIVLGITRVRMTIIIQT